MPAKPFLCLIVFGMTATMAASTGFQLSVNYSEWLNPLNNTGAQIATDNSGALYLLSGASASTVTKLSADGKTILWQNQLGFAATTLTVDANGGVYVIPVRQTGDTPVYVAKLAAGGTGLAWKTPVGFASLSQPVLAVDSQGRAYLAAEYIVNNYITETSNVVRISADGSALEYTAKVNGIPASIAVDPSGAAYVVGTETNPQGVNTGFLARIAPDGSAGYYSILPVGRTDLVSVDAAGNVVVFGSGFVQRVDSTGAVTLTTALGMFGNYALDSAGNAYVSGAPYRLYAVQNTLATCGFDPDIGAAGYAQVLTVVAPDGSIRQATYIPGGNQLGLPLLAVGPNSTVYLVATAGPGFVPTQTGPYPVGASGGSFLSKLSPNGAAQPYALACLGSAATLAPSAIAPGELVTLFGNGLGPQQGVQSQATLQTPYPTQSASVKVTFDGTPAPLLWVQDAQINAVAPWSLTPGRTAQVCVSYNAVQTNCLAWPVVQVAPAVFTTDGQYAAALNQDGTINSATNRAPVGSLVTVFATGLGPIAPSQADGSLVASPLPANVLTVGVEAAYTIGIPFGVAMNTPFDVQYAGPAPAQVAGVSQINFRVASFPSYGQIILNMASTNSPGFQLYIAGQ